MKTHPYLRAYMAGVTVPSLFFELAFAAYLTLRGPYDPGFPVERFMVFPLALVPAVWGAGSLGLGFVDNLARMGWLIVPLVAALYFLVWKYLVSALNRLLGVGPA
ncbi:MAG: hypothetical protein KGN36_09950 [Acidobacteriota bacterium]|nr:hypothetical protein [Acidobacteriota bacterium]